MICPFSKRRGIYHTISSFDGLGEWVFNLLASVNGRDEDEKSPTGDDEAKGAGRFVAFVV